MSAAMQQPVERLAEGIIRTRGSVWLCAKSRKPGRCIWTGRTYAAGELVYRQIGNGQRRSERILASAVEAAA